MDIEENECIACWSCECVVNIKDIRCNDGFCPYCDQEIELDEHRKD